MKESSQHVLFETIYQQSPISTQIFSPDGKTLMVNTAWEKLWNLTFKQIKDYNILKDKQLEATGVLPYIKRGFKGETAVIPPNKYNPSKTIKMKGAEPHRWVQAIIYPIKNEKGTLQYVVLQHEDITDRMNFEISLKESQLRFKATWDAAVNAMVLSDPNGIVLEANKAYFKLYSYKPEEVIGKNFAIIFSAEYQKKALSEYKKTFQQVGKPGITEAEIITKDGVTRIVESRYSFIEQNKKRIAMLSVIRDITKQKRSEQALRLSEERLRLSIEAGKIGVWDWDIKNSKLNWSDRIYEIYGANPKTFSVNLDNFSMLIHPEDKKRTEVAIKQALDDTKPYNITYRIKTLSGETRWIKTSATVQRDKAGKPIRMLGATSDVTEQKILDQDKNDFISIATHELKTPVTSLKAYAETLQRKFTKMNDELSASQLGKMNAQLDKLTSLISDLLDTTKIDSGKLQMSLEKFNFDELVREIVEELQRTTDKHKIIIKSHTKKIINTDRERLGQVLTNLLSNAIKYSPHTDKIIIKTQATNKEIHVSITDFGVGIPKAKQSKLFERFYRVSGPNGNTFPGLGLGLYISNEIIKRLGGTMYVDSSLGKGSTFSFELPVSTKLPDVKRSLTEEEIKHE